MKDASTLNLNGWLKVKGRDSLFMNTDHGKPLNATLINYVLDGLDIQLSKYWRHFEYTNDNIDVLGSGNFSVVIEHPEDESKVIKVYRKYHEDSVSYKYLQVAQQFSDQYSWIPKAYNLTRLAYVENDHAYVLAIAVIERYEYTLEDWSMTHREDFYSILNSLEDMFDNNIRELLPPCITDVHSENVMVDSDGVFKLTDPIYNNIDEAFAKRVVHIGGKVWECKPMLMSSLAMMRSRDAKSSLQRNLQHGLVKHFQNHDKRRVAKQLHI